MRNSAVPRQEVTFFEALPLEAQQALRRLAGRKDYPDGSTVFATGQEPDVIFLLNAGQIRVTTSSSAHGAVTLRIAGRGEVLGLSAAITGSRHEASAKAVGPVQGDLINRADFLRFLEEHPAAGFQVVQKLSHDISRAQVWARILRGRTSARGRLVTGCAQKPALKATKGSVSRSH